MKHCKVTPPTIIVPVIIVPLHSWSAPIISVWPSRTTSGTASLTRLPKPTVSCKPGTCLRTVRPFEPGFCTSSSTSTQVPKSAYFCPVRHKLNATKTRRKSLKHKAFGGFFIGTPEGTRTPNIQNRNLTLYPIELRTHISKALC